MIHLPLPLLQDFLAYITIFMFGVFFGAAIKEKFHA